MSIRKFCSNVVNSVFNMIRSASQFLLVLGSCMIISMLVIAGYPLTGLLIYSGIMAGISLYAVRNGGINFWQFLMGGLAAGVILGYMGIPVAMHSAIFVLQFVAIPLIMILYTAGAVALSLNWKKLFAAC